jgi:transcriptional regulator with XRE-family HTH domain
MTSDLLTVFGKTLRRFRVKRKISQERLAEIAGLHRNYVGCVERGKQEVGLPVICKLAAALRIKPARLLRGLPRPRVN